MTAEQPTKKPRPWWHWALAATGTAAFIVLLIWGPWWIEGHHLRDNKGQLVSSAGIIVTGFRTMLIALAVGGFTAAGIYYTREKHRLEREQFQHAQDQFAENQKQFETTLRETQRRDEQQADLAREGQVTGRYVEAIKLLGSDNPTQRLGGIHSLGRIMTDSARDRWPIGEVLAAFVRARVPRRTDSQAPQQKLDVQAALSVIGRNPLGFRRLNLSRTDLRGYQLYGLDFSNVIFRESDLSNCHLGGATLRRCDFEDAILQSADLFQAKLNRADLSGADASKANLSYAVLPKASLAGADLEGAKLYQARAAAARGLEYDQVDSCEHDGTTQFPPYITDWLKTRAEEEAAARAEASES
ncbi:pentapeptide repeat-containing protein [Streptomyces sp. NPDC058202]|uniref:pentapeptide repeat-containing protein n=1 Tax=Streptomyces sp. NPDC058202 TaxID=3346380 RepID=UPI0036F12088